MRLSFAATTRRASSLGAFSLAVLSALPVFAAGFDVPVVYTARHQGMGGTAIAYVDDPSAAFHNPAGLQGVHGLSLLGDVSLLLGQFTGSPAAPASASGMQSDLFVVPFMMAAGAIRATPWLSLGLAVFPNAAGGAEFEYAVPSSREYQRSAMSLAAYELTPVASFNVPRDALLPGDLSVGIGYRLTLVTFERQEGARSDPQTLDLDMSGVNAQGFRLGFQYRAGKLFSLGVVYRSRVEATVRADDATVLGQPAADLEIPFVLPAQLGGGIRSDIDRLGVAFDAMYTFQSQNQRSDLAGLMGGNVFRLPNVFDWRDAFTLRFGFEYRLGPAEQEPIRVGYVYEERVSSPAYPSPFTAPPAPIRALTLGGGFVAESWELNLALSMLAGSSQVRVSDLAPPGECPACGFSGEYGVGLTGIYVDFSTDIVL